MVETKTNMLQTELCGIMLDNPVMAASGTFGYGREFAELYDTNETYAARIQRKLMKKQYLVEVATGRRKADIVLKNASYVNVFSNELCHGGYCRGQGTDRRHGRLCR